MNTVFNLRHLRAFWHVAQCGSVSAAADRVFLSQPAVTQAVSKLEAMLETALFVRKSTGVFPTEAGSVLEKRVGRALEILGEGARQAIRTAGSKPSTGFHPFDHMLTTAQLNGFLALGETGNYVGAARKLGVSRPSIHRSVHDIERIAGFEMFARTARGLELTQAGDQFRRSVLLALEELRQGVEEVDLLLGKDNARIVIGSLPLARSFILPKVINDLTAMRPDVKITVKDGAYADLLYGLRHGEIDVIVGALRFPAPADDVVQEVLYLDRLAIAARAGHPLARRRNVDVPTLAQYPWVTPSPNIPTREQFEALFSAAGMEAPSRLVETSSLILIRGLLVGSDRLTIISHHQIANEIADETLTILDVRLAGSDRQIGMTTRHDWIPTSTQMQFVDMLRAVCSEL